MNSMKVSRTHLKRVLVAMSVLILALFLLFTASYTSLKAPFHLKWIPLGYHWDQSPSANTTNSRPSTDHATQDQPTHANATLLKLVPSYIHAIVDPEDATFPRLECPTPKHNRYDYLRPDTKAKTGIAGRVDRTKETVLPKYFFALDLHQCVHLLPRLIGSIVETMRFLGPENCVLSIVEGRSDDGTYEVLLSVRNAIEEIGAKSFFQSSDLNPKVTERIETLAKLRNLAIEPLFTSPETYDADTTVIFLNDIALCMEDILELLHQRISLTADMVCAMDWTYVGPDPTFYDVWIARTMTGDTFFEIPPDGNWDSAWNLFWDSPTARQRYQNQKPFQVFACWNGVTAFTAKPLLENKIKFRSANKKECWQGEPRLWCKDLWRLGYGRIAVVPTVNVEYSDEASKKIKALKGYVSQHIPADGSSNPAEQIEWKADPPAQVKCITDPDYSKQHFVPWDQGLD